jgi:hypothetical protein
VGTPSRRRLPQLRFTVQLFGKSGRSGRTLRAHPTKNHPVQIVRKMPLAYNNQRAPQKDTTPYLRSKTFVKTISFGSLVRPVPVGIRRSVRYVFIVSESCRGRVTAPAPES